MINGILESLDVTWGYRQSVTPAYQGAPHTHCNIILILLIIIL